MHPVHYSPGKLTHIGYKTIPRKSLTDAVMATKYTLQFYIGKMYNGRLGRGGWGGGSKTQEFQVHTNVPYLDNPSGRSET